MKTRHLALLAMLACAPATHAQQWLVNSAISHQIMDTAICDSALRKHERLPDVCAIGEFDVIAPAGTPMQAGNVGCAHELVGAVHAAAECHPEHPAVEHKALADIANGVIHRVTAAANHVVSAWCDSCTDPATTRAFVVFIRAWRIGAWFFRRRSCCNGCICCCRHGLGGRCSVRFLLRCAGNKQHKCSGAKDGPCGSGHVQGPWRLRGHSTGLSGVACRGGHHLAQPPHQWLWVRRLQWRIMAWLRSDQSASIGR